MARRLPHIRLNSNSQTIHRTTGIPSVPTRARSNSDLVPKVNSNSQKVSLKTRKRGQSQLIVSTTTTNTKRMKRRKRKIFITMRRMMMTTRIKIRTIIVIIKIMRKTARARRPHLILMLGLITPARSLINHLTTLLQQSMPTRMSKKTST